MIRHLIICIIFLASTSTHAYSQNNYALQVENIQITTLIDTLSSLSDYTFSYSSDLLNIEEIKSVNITSNTIDGLIEDCLDLFNLENEMYAKNILLRKKALGKRVTTAKSTRLTGYISDANGEPIEFAAIAIPEIQQTVFSDPKGYFEMEVPINQPDLNVIIHMLGFEVIETTVLKLQQNQLTTLKTRLNEIAEILLISKVPTIISDTKNQVIKMNRFDNTASGLAGSDLLRSVQFLPGINASDDSSVEIKIRGSSADETLIVLDGIPLYNTSHYYGVFSSVNEDYIDQMTVYKNAQPINYGNKIGGIVQLSTLKNSNQLSGKINASLLESSLTLSAPVANNTQLTLSGRSTIRNISNTSFNSIGSTEINNDFDEDNVNQIESNPSFNFIDLFGKLKYDDNDKLSGQLSFFVSDDQFSNISTDELESSNRGRLILTENNYKTEEGWNNFGLGFQSNYKLNDILSLNLNSYISNYSIEDKLLSESIFMRRDGSEGESSINEEGQFNSIKNIGLTVSGIYKKDKSKLTTGIKSIRHEAEFFLDIDASNLISTDENFSESTLYSLYEYSLSDKTTITGGSGVTYYSGTGKYYLSPQLNITHTLNNKYSFKFSASRQNQFLNELSIESNFGNFINRWILADNRNFAVSNSTNLMSGIIVKKGGLLIDVEVYYKNLSDISEIFRDNDNLFDDLNAAQLFTVQTGDGRSYGIDFLMAKEFSSLTTQLSYSLSKTEHKFDEISNGEYFLAQDDRRHQLSILNKYSIDNFSIDLNYSFYSGRRFSSLEDLLREENRGRRNTNQNDVTSTLPDYHRVDIGATYIFKNDFYPITIGAGIFNVFNTQNVKYQQQIIGFRERNDNVTENNIIGSESNLLNRTFNLNLSIKF